MGGDVPQAGTIGGRRVRPRTRVDSRSIDHREGACAGGPASEARTRNSDATSTFDLSRKPRPADRRANRPPSLIFSLDIRSLKAALARHALPLAPLPFQIPLPDCPGSGQPPQPPAGKASIPIRSYH